MITVDSSKGILFYDDAENDPIAEWGIPVSQGWNYFSGGDHNINDHDQNSKIVRSTTVKRLGSHSYEVTITKDSSYPECCNCVRSELQFMGGGQPVNNWAWAAMSTYFADDFCFGTERMSVGFNVKKISGNGSHIFQLQIKNGRFYAEFNNFQGDYQLKDLGAVATNTWVDWALHSNWKDDDTGFLRFYKDGILALDIENTPVYDYEGGSKSRDPYIFQGFYKWVWATADGQGEGFPQCNASHTYFIDELKFGDDNASLEDVSPGEAIATGHIYVHTATTPYMLVDGIMRKVAKITYMDGTSEIIEYK